MDGRGLNQKEYKEALKQSRALIEQLESRVATEDCTDSPEAVGTRIQEILTGYEALSKIDQVATFCAKSALVIGNEVSSQSTMKSQLIAYWKLNHLNGEVDQDAIGELANQANAITRGDGRKQLEEYCSAYREAEESKNKHLARIRVVDAREGGYMKLLDQYTESVSLFLESRKMVLETLSGSSVRLKEAFDPDYDYKKDCEKAHKRYRDAMADSAKRKLVSATAVRQMRTDRDWSQQVMAKRAKISVRTVRRLEAADRAVNVRTVGAVATALGVAPEELMSEESEASRANDPPLYTLLFTLLRLARLRLRPTRHVSSFSAG